MNYCKKSENEPGDVVIVENGHQERHRPVLNAERVSGKTLPEIYRAFAPVSAVMPRALEEAQARRVSTPDDTLEGRDENPVLDPESGSSPLGGVAAQHSVARTAAVNWDWNGDANWFLDYFCKTHLSNFCATNAGSAWSWKKKDIKYTYFEVTGMNASFDSGAYLHSDYYKCSFPSCQWRRSWDGHIAPRWYQTLVYTTTRPRYARIDGSGSNARVHFAAMRVIQGDPESPALSVSAQGGYKFRVTGSKFKANTSVYVHIGYGNFTNEATHIVSSNASGNIDSTLYQPCNNGSTLNFAANDGRLNPSTGHDLYSNNVKLTCQ
jgi:hypothetical protein